MRVHSFMHIYLCVESRCLCPFSLVWVLDDVRIIGYGFIWGRLQIGARNWTVKASNKLINWLGSSPLLSLSIPVFFLHESYRPVPWPRGHMYDDFVRRMVLSSVNSLHHIFSSIMFLLQLRIVSAFADNTLDGNNIFATNKQLILLPVSKK